MNRPREDWPRLASYVVSARIAAGYKDRRALSAATGVTDRTLGKLENGQRVSPDTLAAIELAVGWKPDSARTILAGGEPAPVQPPPSSDRREAARRAQEFLDSLSEEDRHRITEDFFEAIARRAARDDRQAGTNGA